ncbi:MAG: ferritin family protein [Lachnospiraceae bacterium]|nr:ferritin family protein [Lachnospiraceae bacterium]
MSETEKFLENSCNMTGVNPALVQLAYPPIRVSEANQRYAEIIKMDYCGSVSELSAVTQYIHTEICLSNRKCEVAKTILGIAMAEMIHLQKLGELIVLLGGSPDYKVMANQRGLTYWMPEWLTLQKEPKKMIMEGIASEKGAIAQYRKHMKMIKDPYILRVIARIIKDEEYHIFLLQSCQI